MSDTRTFGFVVLVAAAAGLIAVLANRFSERVRVPLPAVFLAAAALVKHFADLDAPPLRTVERIVTIALLLILFDGGQRIGSARFRAAAAPIAIVGVLGTFMTVAAAAVLAHFAFDLDWYVAVLVATAISPTDPAVVFSVLGQREIEGRGSTILEGESGVNDPVGIALMGSLVAAGGLGLGAFADVGESFATEMLVGAAVGIAGGRALLLLMRRVLLPNEALYPLLTLASMLLLFGVAVAAHGSGFLAVFAAGIVIADSRAPYKLEIERFHGALASLGEIVAFVVLGLTIDLGVLGHADVLIPGLVLAVALAFVIRPVLVGLCLVPAGLRANERAFVLFAGLKGAVPILLGSFIFAADVANADRFYGIVVVVVVFSVVVQGTLVPTVAHRLKLPVRTVAPEPWPLGVRLRDEPGGVYRVTVAAGAPADGSPLREVTGLRDDEWVSFVVRDQQLVRPQPDMRLKAGDEVLLLAGSERGEALGALFETPAAEDSTP